MVTKAINLLGWLACGGRSCQQALVVSGMIEALVPLLSERTDEEVTRSAWMAINWLIYVDEGKQRFLKAGGLDLLLSALKRAPLMSGVIFACRKLAMHAQCQRSLLEHGVAALLVQRANALSGEEDRMKYVVTLALTFLTLGPQSEAEQQLIEKSGALPFIARMVRLVKIDQNLNVLYTSLNDQLQLLSSGTVTAQLFGLWWTLHLLVSERSGHYKRKDYASMVITDGLLPKIMHLLTHAHDDVAAHFAAQIIEVLCSTPHVRSRVVQEGGLGRLLKLYRLEQSATDAIPSSTQEMTRASLQRSLAVLLTYSPTMEEECDRWDKVGVRSLRWQTEQYVIRAVDDDSAWHLAEVAYAFHLPRLQLKSLGYLAHNAHLIAVPDSTALDSSLPKHSREQLCSDLAALVRCLPRAPVNSYSETHPAQ